jgi:hypothetical protein
MVTFKSIVLAPVVAGDSEPPPAPPRPDALRVRPLVASFRRGLLQRSLDAIGSEPGGRLDMAVDVPPLGRLRLIWMPSGLTAGVAVWLHNDAVVASSILKSGIDKREDASAIAALAQSQRLSVPGEAWDTVIRAGPPLLATLYVGETAVQDGAVAAASTALAGALFGLLGVGTDEAGDDSTKQRRR